MARVFRHTYSKALPEGSEVLTRRGKKYARFKDGRGKTLTAPLSQDGKKVIREASKWYIEYKDNDGKMRKVPGFKDKQATEQKASELERDAERVRSGYKPKEHEQLCKPLKEHIEDFRRFLESKGSGKSYVAQTVKRVEHLFEVCKFAFWSDISASKIMNGIAGLKYKGQKLSTQTFNYYLQSIKQFCRWLVQDGRAAESPVENLKNVKVVPTFERRARTPDEFRTLLEATEARPVRFGLTGHERAMLYRFAAETGLRANEIRSLKVSNFDFDDFVVIAQTGYTKNVTVHRNKG